MLHEARAQVVEHRKTLVEIGLSAAGADARLSALIPHERSSYALAGRAANKFLRVALPWRVPLGYAFAVAYIILARPASFELFGVTAALVILGCTLRSWAAGHLIKGKRVAVGGPYAYVRNPLYAGSFIIGVGCCVALWNLPIPVTSVIMWAMFLIAFVVVYPMKARAEEKELCVSLNGPYEAYAKKVPAFMPWKGQVRGLGLQSFSWEIYRQNREYQCVLGAVGILSLLYLKYIRVV